ncbi:unnamed protein product [Didymodactylos carnosus]|uniref:Uncharacterized protein n=1 Tax=Didymodactylos carnosus TaxID=1234261 RepID=A0A815TBE7_9BILA|nr:unnamed protein product [Didymodactylos carnosus]CAF1502771.1 unnamed protein product [Didymodactylos carnosus]CAF4146883.1 unnamed protein product [Didymodactylos carnosus]CAF4364331.1 unnamed protein product [Didymodactylos carnosus]
MIKIVKRSIHIRNVIAHQNQYNTLEEYEHAIETLIQLASLISQPDVVEEIRSLIRTIDNDTLPASPDSLSDSTFKSNVAWQQLKEQGNMCFSNKQWTQAMNFYSEAIHLDSKQAVLYSNRALCEINLKKYQLAREDAEDAIDLDNKQIKYFRVLSEALMGLELYSEAKGICNEGLKINPCDEILLVRSRDCSAFIAIQQTDQNARIDPETYAQQAMKMSLSEHMAKCNNLTPKPSDVRIMTDMSEMMEVYQTNNIVNTAHKHRDGLFGTPKDEHKAMKLYDEASKRGSAEGLYNLSLFYERGLGGLVRDFVLSFECMEKAALQKAYHSVMGQIFPNIGVAEAENGLGNVYRLGKGRDIDLKKAVKWYLKSAEHGCPQGQNNLGFVLRNGLGIKEDLQTARHWYQQAAEQGLTESELNYAEFLEAGFGGPVDLKLAEVYYKKAAKQGQPRAMKGLQDLERSMSTTSTKAKKCLSTQISSKDPHALFLLGSNYHTGQGGVEKSLFLAEQYWKTAAELGHAELNSPSLKIKISAEKGSGIAQGRLSQLFAFGHGCLRDEKQAARWAQRATCQGVRLMFKYVRDAEPKKINIEGLIRCGKEICDFESTLDLSTEGVTIHERFERLLRSLFKGSQKGMELVSNFSTLNSFLLAPAPSHIAPLPSTDKWLPELPKRAAQGSVTARNILQAFDIVMNAKRYLSTGQVDDALCLFREAFRYHDRVIPDLSTFLSAAEEKLKENPNNSNAMYVVARKFNRSTLEQVKYLERCVELHPLEADFHQLLACCYGFAGDSQWAFFARASGL